MIVLNETGTTCTQINNEARRLIGLPRFTHINQLATIDRSLQELFFAIRGGERKQASLLERARYGLSGGQRVGNHDPGEEAAHSGGQRHQQRARRAGDRVVDSPDPRADARDHEFDHSDHVAQRYAAGNGKQSGGRGSRGTGSDQFDRQEPDPLRGSLSQGDPHSDSPARRRSMYKPFLERMAKLAEPYTQKENASRPASHLLRAICWSMPTRT